MFDNLPDLDWEKLSEAKVNLFEISWRARGSFWDSGWRKAEASNPEDANELMNFLIIESQELGIDFEATLYCRAEGYLWLRGYDSDKMRVAHPKHRVFVSIGGRDCDGFSWREYRSFRNLEEAAKEMNGILYWADGPTGYETLSREEWELGTLPEYRDIYAESMGY